ncbi:DUF2637 domain-containing protein [Streptomyces sp. NPDC058155]|uniref:DUF2637 domain-containing protein n=1 Tax=Streptomyces sp. NPDC058155 TaxID=3346359 RepID=UPI0036E17B73
MKRPDARQGLAAGAAVATVALTAVAFWLSYDHLHAVAATNGLDGARAWAWPATVDLFVIIGELLMLRASLRGSVDWWAIGLAATGSLGSIALNVAGVGTDATALEYVVAAVPPTAALVAFGALMRQVHERLAVAPEAAVEPAGRYGDPVFRPVPEPMYAAPEPAEPKPEPITLEREHEPVDTPPPAPVLGAFVPVAELMGGTAGTGLDQHAYDAIAVAGTRAEPVPEPTAEPATPTGSDLESEDTADTRFERYVEDARAWLRADPTLTGTAIGTKLGTSDAYGRRVRRAALAALAST